jgi:hypothetical protein
MGQPPWASIVSSIWAMILIVSAKATAGRPLETVSALLFPGYSRRPVGAVAIGPAHLLASEITALGRDYPFIYA